RRVLAQARTLAELEALLGGDGVRALWDDAVGAAPAAARRRRDATSGARTPRLALAEAPLAAGRWAAALAARRRERGFESRLLAAWCHLHLGRDAIARRTIGQLETERRDPAQRLALAELAVRITLDEGDVEGASVWVDRVERAAGRELAPRAALLA